jgi:hypothetical protein
LPGEGDTGGEVKNEDSLRLPCTQVLLNNLGEKMRRREEEEEKPQELPRKLQELPKEQKDKIVKALVDRGAKLPCPRCGNNSFTLLDGYFNQTIQTELKGMVIGGPSIPSIVVACTRCGFLSQHALGVLGLLPKEEVKK